MLLPYQDNLHLGSENKSVEMAMGTAISQYMYHLHLVHLLHIA